ncbi:MAG TPA: 4'-phosphopantetheinyl transferase superfamily protein [Rhizomicrobium sp.]|jgi:4'-phosphopantetheinyl transferase EntD|nr:4'-phosphopantetheinyl transferase superfamily protein [Rhizomicrobium sp.]HSS13651.1 4'-phosphopantetheinyl transferase superfamily protein [Rhizomicrobium sp.]
MPRLLVPGLSGAEIWDEGQPVEIHPDEDIHVARSAPKRRRDFALGRACARAALASFGHGNAVIAKGDNGAPVWPAGIAGSITHTGNYAAALVGDSSSFAGIGIDAELSGGVTRDLWPRLFSEAEQTMLGAHPDPLLAATLLFSAKEASYKTWALKGALAFREIEIMLEEECFTAAHAGARLHGRHAVKKGVVLVAAWISR